MSKLQYYENYFGVLLTIRILKYGNLINNEEKNILFNKIGDSNINTIIIDSHLNYGILTLNSQLIENFLKELREVFNGQIVLSLSIFGELSLDNYSNNILFNYFDNIILDLQIEKYLISTEEKLDLLIAFYNLKKKKILLNQEFLDLDRNILDKYCTGFLIGTLRDLERMESYGNFCTIVHFSLIHWGNTMIFQGFWDYIIFNRYLSIVHILTMPLLDLFEILQSTIYLNDQEVKIEIIGKIRQLESQIMKTNLYSNGFFPGPWGEKEEMEKISNQIMELTLQRKNHLLQDLDL